MGNNFKNNEIKFWIKREFESKAKKFTGNLFLKIFPKINLLIDTGQNNNSRGSSSGNIESNKTQNHQSPNPPKPSFNNSFLT